MREETASIFEFSERRSSPYAADLREPDSGDLEWLFGALYDIYGPRNWWPTVHGGKFELAVGAILVQNISWRNTERALINMREADIWSFDAILEAPIDRLQDVIRPSGYYRAKSRKLREFASFVVEKHEGDLDRLFRLEIGDMREQLLSVWGIGEETADDIILYGAKKPSFVVDSYTKRLLNRLGWTAEQDSYQAYQRLFHAKFPRDVYLYNEFHALIDYHCARICQKTPQCGQCELAGMCPVGLGVKQP